MAPDAEAQAGGVRVRVLEGPAGGLVLIALMIAMLLAMLDKMIIGTAMPTIVGELGGLEHLSWVVTAYTLASTASTPLWGKLGDMYGRKGSSSPRSSSSSSAPRSAGWPRTWAS